MISKNVEECGHCVHSDLLTILYYSLVSYPKKSGLVRKSTHTRPIYLITNFVARPFSGPYVLILLLLLLL
jgi:hypothetical protein